MRHLRRLVAPDRPARRRPAREHLEIGTRAHELDHPPHRLGLDRVLASRRVESRAALRALAVGTRPIRHVAADAEQATLRAAAKVLAEPKLEMGAGFANQLVARRFVNLR